KRGLDAGERSEKVRLDDVAVCLDRSFLYDSADADAGVVHEDVDTAMLSEQLGEQTSHSLVVGHVERSHVDAARRQPGRRRIEHGCDYLVAVLREATCGRVPDSCVATGYESDGHLTSTFRETRSHHRR